MASSATESVKEVAAAEATPTQSSAPVTSSAPPNDQLTTSASNKYDPIVIVTSLGATVTAEDIVNNIRGIPFADNRLTLVNGHIGLRYTIVTKYYTSNVLLVVYDRPLGTLPQCIQDVVEGVLVYFDAENRNILKLIDDHLHYVKNNGLQLLMLICDKLYDDARRGMTYKEVKQCTQAFIDVIELGRSREEGDTIGDSGTLTSSNDNDDYDDDSLNPTNDHHDPVGYAELLQVLQNHIWSNVDLAAAINAVGTSTSLLNDDEADDDGADADVEFKRDLADFMKATTTGEGVASGAGMADCDKQFVQEVAELMMAGSSSSPTTAKSQKSSKTGDAGKSKKDAEQHDEAELLNFEKLLNDLVIFRQNSASLSRNERFAYTQNFADAFDQLIGDGVDDDDGDGNVSDNEPDKGGGVSTSASSMAKD